MHVRPPNLPHISEKGRPRCYYKVTHCTGSVACMPLLHQTTYAWLAKVSGQQGDKYLRFDLLYSHLYMHIYLECFGSLLAANQTGHKLAFNDRKIATPSVLQTKEIFDGCERNSRCRLYSLPPYTSSIILVVGCLWNLNCSALHISLSVKNRTKLCKSSACKVGIKYIYTAAHCKVRNFRMVKMYLNASLYHVHFMPTWVGKTHSHNLPSKNLFNCSSSETVMKQLIWPVEQSSRTDSADGNSLWHTEQYPWTVAWRSGKSFEKNFLRLWTLRGRFAPSGRWTAISWRSSENAFADRLCRSANCSIKR